MLLQLGEIPWWRNTLATLCTWLLLAGLCLSGVFISICNSRRLLEKRRRKYSRSKGRLNIACVIGCFYILRYKRG